MSDPLSRFAEWYADAQREPLVDPDLIALATATPDGRPSVRMVFFRGIREGGFSFFTNYESRKGIELNANPNAAIVFYWPHLGRQVRVEGPIERLSPAESDAYFRSRAFESQVSAVVSQQSRPMLDPEEFALRLSEMEAASRGHRISRPETWGGFKIIPSAIEFWVRGEHRRHFRLLYERRNGEWTATRLYP